MNKRRVAKLGTIAVALVLAASVGTSSLIASAQNYYTDYDSQEEAWSEAEELNKEIAGEGIVLLKNKDNALPIESGARISVLGIAQDELVETSGSVAESLQNAGYNVNPTLMNFYANDGSTSDDYMTESELTSSAKQSIDLYNDVAVVVLARGGSGEARDRMIDTRFDVSTETLSLTGEVDDEEYLGTDSGWEHENHYADDEGNEYKHELQLSDSEQELIKLAKEKCDKVVIMYSSANVFEMGNLEDDDGIDAILWIGRTGDGGIDAIGEILNGTINPSGKVVDEWTRDLTNDPTYFNITQTYYADSAEYDIDDVEGDMSSSFAYYDYEEGIYLGYKYYETYWYEASQGNANPTINGDGTTATADEWYDYNVVYPFGYGLSYTSFEFSDLTIKTNSGDDLGDTVTADSLTSSVGNPADITSLTAEVTVTNTGDYAGKEVVQVYVTVPYTQGQTEKTYLNLAGFVKTDTIKPGASQTVEVTFNVQDFASYDYNDANDDDHTGYELDTGEYTIHVMNSSSHENFGTAAYQSFTFTVEGTTAACLDIDDYSGNEISNKFSDENGDYDSMLLTENSSDPMTELSRADFDGTFPSLPDGHFDVGGNVTLSLDAINTLNKYRSIDADYFDDDDYDEWYGAYMTAYDEYTGGDDEVELPSNWTQGAGVADSETGLYELTLDDMAGVSFESELWDTFLNQLTWEEMGTLLNYGYHGTLAVDSIGKLETSDENGPNHVFSEFYWCMEPTIAATWNTELAERQGMMVGTMLLYLDCTGWYGPGVNIHRSAFSGRSAEYYSQDTLLSGYIAAAVTKGAQSRGINVYVKHLGLYDQAPQSATYHGVNASEQVIRENYLTAFRMAMQEGGASATMNEYGRIGAVYAGTNYNLLTGVIRNEWGWEGVVVTDMIRYNETADGLIRAGGVLIDGDFVNGTSFISGTYTWGTHYTCGGSEDPDHVHDDTCTTEYDRTDTKALSGEWDSTLRGGLGAVTVNGKQNDEQWYCARLAVKRLLYMTANSAANYNGITSISSSVTVSATQGTSVSANLLDDEYYTHESLTAEVTSGSLPDGMTVSGGVLSGTPVTSGTYEATVTVTVDGWIEVTVNVTVDVDSVFSIDGETSVSTGDNTITYVVLDGASNFTIVDGALPEGLTLDSEGLISGVATTAGEYTFTVSAELNGTTYYETITITVTGDDVVVVTVTSVELSGNNIVVTYSDGTTTTIALPESAGNTVADVTLSEDGSSIIVTYTDDTTSTIDLSSLTEVTVEEDSGCGSAVNGLIGMAVAIPVIAGVALVLHRRRSKSAKSDE